MPKCPFCQTTERQLTNKEWDYAAYHVKCLTCSKCGKHFKAYYWDGKLSHTIPKLVTDKNRIISFLRIHKEASVFEILQALNLDAEKVEELLLELQEEGRVRPE